MEKLEEINLDTQIKKISDAQAQGELLRIEKIRQERGDEAWAEVLGSSIITQLTLIIQKHNPENRSLYYLGLKTLELLTPQLQELHEHPIYGVGATAGMIEELASRQFVSLEVNDLISSRWKKQGLDYLNG